MEPNKAENEIYNLALDREVKISMSFPTPDWKQRFDEQFLGNAKLENQQLMMTFEAAFILKFFISQLLSEVINEIPDRYGYSSTKELKQQLKDKYGITN